MHNNSLTLQRCYTQTLNFIDVIQKTHYIYYNNYLVDGLQL
jgi:hypothetical protein